MCSILTGGDLGVTKKSLNVWFLVNALLLQNHTGIWRINKQLCNENKLEILGNSLNTSGTSLDHVNHRINKGRHAFYGLFPDGMTYPGASTEVQSYLFKRICQPTPTYGIDCMSITDNDIHKLESMQGQ